MVLPSSYPQRMTAHLIELTVDTIDSLLGVIGLSQWEHTQTDKICISLSQELARRPFVALEELSEDFGTTFGQAFVPTVVPLLVGVHVGPLALSTLTIQTKALYGASSMLIAIGAVSVFGRHPRDETRIAQRQCAAALFACSGMHLALALTSGFIPIPVPLYCPEVAFHYVGDFIINPLLLLNLGFIAGVPPREMIPTMIFSFLGTTVAIGAAVAPEETQRLGCLAANVCCIGCTVKRTWDLPAKAASLSWHNKRRCQAASDIMILTSAFYPIAQGATIVGILTLQSQLHIFAVLDMLSKWGVAHLLLRSEKALQHSIEHDRTRS